MCRLICNVFATLLVIVTIAAFLFWLIVRPNVVNFQVTNATLAQFSYTNDTLCYNLTLNVEVRNPNRNINIYYNYMEALALYQEVRLSSLILGTYFQPRENTTMLSPVFNGQKVMLLNRDHISEIYNNERRSGIYHIDVKMNLKVKFDLGWYKTMNLMSKVNCHLQVPLQSYNGTSPAGGFQATPCNWDYKHILFIF